MPDIRNTRPWVEHQVAGASSTPTAQFSNQSVTPWSIPSNHQRHNTWTTLSQQPVITFIF